MHKVKSDLDSAERGHIDGLSADGTTLTDTGGVFTGATELHSVNEDLKGVVTSEEVDELEDLLNDAHSHLLLTVVAATRDHHHGDETLNDGALNLLELALLVAASSVGDVDLLLDGANLEVSSEGDVVALDAIVGPLSEEFGLNSEFGLVFLKLDILNLNFCHSKSFII